MFPSLIQRFSNFSISQREAAGNCGAKWQVAIRPDCAVLFQFSCKARFVGGHNPDETEAGLTDRFSTCVDDGGEDFVGWGVGFKHREHRSRCVGTQSTRPHDESHSEKPEQDNGCKEAEREFVGRIIQATAKAGAFASRIGRCTRNANTPKPTLIHHTGLYDPNTS